ncbi:hypothetical protein JCM1840_007085 [Sporobolomyces johnsonii]
MPQHARSFAATAYATAERDRNARHLSCEGCRKRKMKCSRTDPCVACTLRGQECVWQDCKPTQGTPKASLSENRLEITRLSKVVDQLQALVYERDGRYCYPEAPPTPPKYLDPSSPPVSSPHVSELGYAPDSSPPSQRAQRGMGAPFAPAPYGMLSSQWAASTGYQSAFSPSYPPYQHHRFSTQELGYRAPSPSSGYNPFRHQPHHQQHASFPSSSASYPSPHYHPTSPVPATSTSSYCWPPSSQARSSTWPVQHPSSDSTALPSPSHLLPTSSTSSSSTSHSRSHSNGMLSQPPHLTNDTANLPIPQTMSSLPLDLETVQPRQQEATEEDWAQMMVLPEDQQL